MESYRRQAQASDADLAVVNLTIHANLAIDYFAARTLDTEEKLLQNTVVQYEQALQLNEDLYEGGLASEVEVDRHVRYLNDAGAVNRRRGGPGTVRARGCGLIGKSPANFSLPPLLQLHLRRFLLASVRAVRTASRYRRFRTPSRLAERSVGLAEAAYYPLVNIVASGGFESGDITALLQGPSAIWSIGAAAAVTVFDGGRRRAARMKPKTPTTLRSHRTAKPF